MSWSVKWILLCDQCVEQEFTSTGGSFATAKAWAQEADWHERYKTGEWLCPWCWAADHG